MQIKSTSTKNSVAKFYKLHNYLFGTFLALFIGIVNADESWKCDDITIPAEYTDLRQGFVPVGFSLTIKSPPTPYAVSSLSKRKAKIQGTYLGVSDSGTLTSLTDKLANYPNIEYTIRKTKFNPYSSWEVTFSKWVIEEHNIRNWVSETVTLTGCKQTLPIDIEQPNDKELSPNTPLRDQAKGKSCLARCCGWMCGSGDNSSSD